MKILITGSAGFIGSHLHEKLENDGHEIIGIDNWFHSCKNPITRKVRYADVRNRNEMEKLVEWCDVVFHLAAQIHVDRSIADPQETIDINVTGTLNVLEAVRKFDKKMVFASSSEVYGSSQTELMNEQHPLNAQSPYAASKVAGDRLCKAYYDTYGTKVAILRNFNTFGTYQSDDSYGGVIAIFARKTLRGEALEIYGTGEQERDYMWIDDAIAGYELCLEKELWGKPINIGSGKTVSINELATMIREMAKSNSPIIHVKSRPGEVMRLCADTAFARSLGFKSTTKLDEHLKQYVNQVQQSLHG